MKTKVHVSAAADRNGSQCTDNSYNNTNNDMNIMNINDNNNSNTIVIMIVTQQ